MQRFHLPLREIDSRRIAYRRARTSPGPGHADKVAVDRDRLHNEGADDVGSDSVARVHLALDVHASAATFEEGKGLEVVPAADMMLRSIQNSAVEVVVVVADS